MENIQDYHSDSDNDDNQGSRTRVVRNNAAVAMAHLRVSERRRSPDTDNEELEGEEIEETCEDIMNESGSGNAHGRKRDNSEPIEMNMKQKQTKPPSVQTSSYALANGSAREMRSSAESTTTVAQEEVETMSQICAYIPMRLTPHERLMLNVLENALEVCEYTDIVDVTFSHTRKSKSSRIIECLVDTLSISCGLLCSHDLREGENIMNNRTLNDNVPLFCDLFEIGRRFKIMNPHKMRNTYGKLMYLLMDAESYNIKAELKVNFVKPILTIKRFLDEKGALAMLKDPLLLQATVLADYRQNSNSPRGAKIIKETTDSGRAAAIAQLKAKYATSSSKPAARASAATASAGAGSEEVDPTTDNSSPDYSSRQQPGQQQTSASRPNTLTEEDIQRIIDSIADNEAFKQFNVGPVLDALRQLTTNFDPRSPQEGFSLDLRGTSRPAKMFSSAISSLYTGSYYGGGFSSRYFGGGACLSHDHATQYTFVLQSLTLWYEIMHCMPKLWLLADADMITESYRLVDTGQGYQRLQSCPRVGGEMRRILNTVQSKCGSWVGLSVVHLGDRDVPNALVFIDKYTQVPRILKPITQCIDALKPMISVDRAFNAYVCAEWGSVDGLRLQILSDFFKHGYDGSGDDGGSCIDGRLTSAWNWCSKLHKKPYYYVFMFTGFQGFDGDWKEE